MRSKRQRQLAMAIAAGAVLSTSLPALALTPDTWTFNGSGSWTVSSNWSLGTPIAGSIPTSSHNDAVSRTITYDYGGASIQFLSWLIENSGSGSEIFSQSANTFNVGTETVGNTGTGYWILGGGTHNIAASGFPVYALAFGANSASSRGTGTMSGGVLNVTGGSELIGFAGAGSFFQSGGTHTVTANLVLADFTGSTGFYALSGSGVLNAPTEYVGYQGPGTFNQSAGSNSATQFLELGAFSTGTYLLSGTGSLSVGFGEYIGDNGGSFGNGAGTFIQSGGTHSVGTSNNGVLYIGAQTGSSGSYSLTGGSLTVSGNEFVGFDGVGNFNQTGGAHTVSSELEIGEIGGTGAGTYNLTGGTLSVGNVIVGANGHFLEQAGVLGATFSGFLINNGTFTFRGGTFNGRLINYAAADLGNDQLNSILATGGIENHGQMTISPFQEPTANGTGWDNFGTFTLANGTLLGTVFTNDDGGVLNGMGTIFTSLQNFGTINPNGKITATSATNHGVINLGPAASVDLFSLLNSGAINLSGGALVGSGTITNSIGGIIAGGGNVRVAVVPQGGELVANNPSLPLNILGTVSPNTSSSQIVVAPVCALFFAGAFSNAGMINLQGPGALLSVASGTISNTGTIRGSGSVNAPIANIGIIRPEGGELDLLASGITNGSSGQIVLDAGDTLVLTSTILVNGGNISLVGGTLDTNNLLLSNNGTISGQGTLRTGGLSNSATMTFGNGTSNVIGTNSNLGTSHVTITGAGTATFYNDVVNNPGATFKVDVNSTAIFLGNVSGVSAITGGGTKYFAGTASGGPIVTSGNSIVEPTGALNIDFIRENSLSIDGMARLTPDGTPAHVSRLNSLAISAGGSFDLADNDLIVDAVPLSTIATYISTGYHAGDWNDHGLTSSSAESTAATAHKTALGYAAASSIGATTFDAQSVAGTSVLVRYTFSGDANIDGTVNALDFNAVASNFGGSSTIWAQGDFNYDGVVNTADFTALAANFGQVLPAPPLGSLVPEPRLLLVILPGTLLLVSRRVRACMMH